MMELIYNPGKDEVDFGVEATNKFVHDAVDAYQYEWDPNFLRSMANRSIFMATCQSIMRTPLEHRTAHEHVLMKMYEAVQKEMASA